MDEEAEGSPRSGSEAQPLAGPRWPAVDGGPGSGDPLTRALSSGHAHAGAPGTQVSGRSLQG